VALSDYEINILLESNGKSLEVSRCYELIGCEASDYVVNTQPNALLDGAAFINNNVEPREISMAATCTEKRRDFLVRFFNPKQEIKATIKMHETTRWITGYVSDFQFVQNRVGNKNAFEVSLNCPDPFFKNMDSFGKNIANIVSMFAFPFISPIAPQQNADGTYHWIKDHVSGYRQFNNKVMLDNEGDMAVGVAFRIEARGAIVNPQITLSTGEFIKINRTLAQGDILTIDTSRGNKRIEINGVNSFHYIDRSSTMFLLDVGPNDIEYDADSGYTNMDVYVYYTPQYLGI
jgi:phage-related protein